MRDDPLNSASIPWSHPSSWSAAQRSFHHHTAQLSNVREPLMGLAQDIEVRLHALAEPMDRLCAHTCTHCPDPCCLKASVWYDFRDLLGLHLYGKSLPVGQPITDYGDICRYSSHSGCTLPRSIRPWICTWYICPVQAKWLRTQAVGAGQSLEEALVRIKKQRFALEERFLAVIC